MKKKRMAIRLWAGLEGGKYLLRHPWKGTRNLLALRGMKSIFWTKRAAVVTAATAATAVAVPLAIRAARNSEA
jgi:hypothetical protein